MTRFRSAKEQFIERYTSFAIRLKGARRRAAIRRLFNEYIKGLSYKDKHLLLVSCFAETLVLDDKKRCTVDEEVRYSAIQQILMGLDHNEPFTEEGSAKPYFVNNYSPLACALHHALPEVYAVINDEVWWTDNGDVWRRCTDMPEYILIGSSLAAYQSVGLDLEELIDHPLYVNEIGVAIIHEVYGVTIENYIEL